MRFLKWSLIIVGALLLLGYGGLQLMQHQTKKLSPEVTSTYEKDGLRIDLFYNAPSKRGRVIFGELVPYDSVWRTGANEPTTFTTNRDLTIGGKTLPAGKYTLWTIPGEHDWQVIFNKKMYRWGVGWDTKPSREPAEDALQVSAPAETVPEEVERFTIRIEDLPTTTLVMAWDHTRIAVPLR